MSRTIIMACLFFTTTLLAQENQIIRKIRTDYYSIRKQMPGFKVDTLTIMDLSTEGGEAVSYRDKDNTLRLLALWRYGETGKQYDEYYFNNDSLLFIYSARHHYNAPFYLDDETAKEMGAEAFDPQKTRVKENRYYFHDNHLIRWLDDDKT